MENRPGYWTYALATGIAILLELAIASAFQITGRWDVALMIAMLAGVCYAVTPAEMRDQAVRVFGTAGLALGCFIVASGAGVALGMAVAAPVMLRDGADAIQPSGDLLVMIIAIGAASAAYLALFRLGFSYVAPRPEPAASSSSLPW